MTIDEAIEKHKIMKKASELHNDKRGVFYSAEEHEQLAEWLEELKALKENSISKETFEKMKSRAYKKGHRQGYNKAIDDLLGGMNQITYNCQDADELFEKICDLAEQLKAGK